MNTRHVTRLCRPLYAIINKQHVVKSAKNESVRYQSTRRDFITDAEKVVGYPTSFLSLRWVLNDEVANVALHIRKLLGTNHPLLKSARELLLGNHKPTWGLIVLLVSKAAGIKAEFADVDRDVTAGILHSQRVLAEITEMMKTSNIIHKSLQNVDKINTKDADDVNFGNKLALLTGDYLLSTCFRELAVLRNQAVNELVSTALRDLSEAEFLGPRDLYNRQLPAPPKLHRSEIVFPNQYDSEPYKVENVLGNAKAEWTLRNLLGGATLLAKCCQGALQLGGHSVELQKEAYKIGRNMALAWQLKVEKESITAVDQYTAFNLTCAPMLFHLEDEPRFYIDLEKLPEDVDYFGLRERLRSGSGLKKTHALQLEFSLLAQEAIDKLPDSKSKGALSNVLNAT